MTLGRLIHTLGWPRLARRGLARATGLGLEAIAALTCFEVDRRDQLGELSSIRGFPGFPRALAQTHQDLRMAQVSPDAMGGAPPLMALYREFERKRAASCIADRAELIEEATLALAEASVPRLALVDVEVRSPLEAQVSGGARSPSSRGPHHHRRRRSPNPPVPEPLHPHRVPPEPLSRPGPRSSAKAGLLNGVRPSRCRLRGGRGHLGAGGGAGVRRDRPSDPPESGGRCSAGSHGGAASDSRRLSGPPGVGTQSGRDSRHTSPRGTFRPDPAGRAFLALLECAAENLSAVRFGEYLSLDQVPSLSPGGAPPEDRTIWTPPQDDSFHQPSLFEELDDDALGRTRPPSVPQPRQWEAYLVEAAVIGSRHRWEQRLNGLAHELRLKLDQTEAVEPDAPRAGRIRREIENLEHLRRFALPLLDVLGRRPEGANWGDWLRFLERLAPMALAQPQGVLAALAELNPLTEVGPVTTRDVVQVLSERLTQLELHPPPHPGGRVFVVPLTEARGLEFDTVFLPGLAERLFPEPARAKTPLLPDRRRVELSAHLGTLDDARIRERLLLRLGLGAASRRLVLSFPRLDVAQSRPRVPSFYLLDVLRGLTGRIGELAALEREVADASNSRLAWPAPQDPAEAIDGIEHDLSVLGQLLAAPADRVRGRARYLLDLNPHLGRSLRSRYLRWQPGWSWADGIVRPSEPARQALEGFRLNERAYSVTSLQRFAACPYQFLLASIHRLQPREEKVAIEKLDPLTRGALIHEAQADVLRALEAEGFLPLAPDGLSGALELADQQLELVAARRQEDLSPAILRVWQDELAAIRTDLRTWLSQLADQDPLWVPHRFEMGFGIPQNEGMDPRSLSEDARMGAGHRLHGIVDLVERHTESGELRVTDYKTGRVNVSPGWFAVAGGRVLQPVLYGAALESLLGTPVDSGRLWFCTSRGRFEIREVQLTDRTRELGTEVLKNDRWGDRSGLPRRQPPDRRVFPLRLSSGMRTVGAGAHGSETGPPRSGPSPEAALTPRGPETPLADASDRARIQDHLERNLVVEAAAGTGKTTELVGRIVRILAEGRTTVDRLMAVTFTEKAAGELKLRLRAELDRAGADSTRPDEDRKNVQRALAHLEEARVNTIHGLCADLLREQTAAAGVDPRFVTLTEPDAQGLYAEGFGRWFESALSDPPEGLRRSLPLPSPVGRDGLRPTGPSGLGADPMAGVPGALAPTGARPRAGHRPTLGPPRRACVVVGPGELRARSPVPGSRRRGVSLRRRSA